MAAPRPRNSWPSWVRIRPFSTTSQSSGSGLGSGVARQPPATAARAITAWMRAPTRREYTGGMRRVLVVAVGWGVVAAAAAGARAQPAPAERPVAELVAEGEQLAQSGKIAESLPLFREAAQREPS